MISSLQNNVVSFKGNSKESVEKKEAKKIDISGKIDEFNKETEEVTESIAKTTETVTSSIGTIGTSAAGICAITSGPFKKVLNFFSKEKLDEAGNVITKKLFGKDGKPLINKETGEEVVRAIRTADWKKIGIFGGIIAGTIATFAIIKAISNKGKNEVQQGDTVEISKKANEAKSETTKEAEATQEVEEFEE